MTEITVADRDGMFPRRQQPTRDAQALTVKPPDTLRALLRRSPTAVLEVMRLEGAEFPRLLHGPEALEALAAAGKRPPDWSRAAHPLLRIAVADG